MKREQITRVREILEGDRLGIGGECKKAIVADLENLLGEYFTVNGIKVDIQSDGNGFVFNVKAFGAAFKNFRHTTII